MASGVSLPSEMLSGPDLGGGYLHQLSFDRATATTFTYHAQEGGADAGGPPQGPLDALGYAHPPSPCMFGGPRCWHRRFLLPLEATPLVRQAYNRSRFVFATMLAQLYGEARPDIEGGLAEVLARAAPALEAERIEWYVGGSAGAWLLGAPLAPRDIDLGTTRAGVDRFGELLRPYLIEPVAPTELAGGRIVRGARAFLGTFAQGIRVEWAVPIDVPRDPVREEFGGDPHATRTLATTFRGRPIRVARPEYALVRALVRGREEVARALEDLVRSLGPDRELLGQLLEPPSVPPSARERLRTALLG